MKKLIGGLLLTLITSAGYSQVSTNAPVVHLSTIPPPHIENGKPTGYLVKRSAILANDLIVSDEPNYVVKEYTISFAMFGKDFLGPFKTKGNQIKPDFKNVIAENDRGTVFFENIVVDCNGILRTANPIILKYNN